MKKNWLLMLLMCAIMGAFTACSSDDESTEGQSPVSGVSVPSTGKVGNEVVIQGSGFTGSGIVLYLEDSSDVRTQMSATFTNSGASFTVPMTVAAGTYSVVLVQNGKD